MELPTSRAKMIHPGLGHKGSGETAVYRLYGSTGQLLYIGISRNPMWRWGSHVEQHSWWRDVDSFEIDWQPSREAAEEAEKLAIAQEKPIHNVTHTSRHSERILAGVARQRRAL